VRILSVDLGLDFDAILSQNGVGENRSSSCGSPGFEL
jgi:hypothetical protein